MIPFSNSLEEQPDDELILFSGAGSTGRGKAIIHLKQQSFQILGNKLQLLKLSCT